jgi:ribosome biogenesis GTPase
MMDEGGLIQSIAPRHNVLERGDFRGHPRPLAANIDRLVLVIAPAPTPDALLIDRYLVLARAMGLAISLWINKTDLMDTTRSSRLEQLLKRYQSLGIQALFGSAITGAGLAALRKLIATDTVILAGQSGVGKSSLAQGLIPSLDLRVGEISKLSGQGRHTTTETTRFECLDGGALIDSPGVRTLRLDHLSPGDVLSGFPEIQTVAKDCRFRDCHHDHEPECAVKAALQNGTIDLERFENWRALTRESVHH